MDLQQEWANMDAELSKSAQYNLGDTAVRESSKDLLATLVKGLKTKMIWIRVFSVPALVAAIFAPAPLKYVLLGIFLIYEVARYLSVQKLKNINPDVNYSDVTKALIARQLQLVNEVLKIERIWGYIFIPLSAPLGFIMAMLASHHSLAAMLQKFSPVYWVVIYLVIVTSAFTMTKWMNKVAFGKYIKELQEKMEQLGE